MSLFVEQALYCLRGCTIKTEKCWRNLLQESLGGRSKRQTLSSDPAVLVCSVLSVRIAKKYAVPGQCKIYQKLVRTRDAPGTSSL
jgi:hypothetical protein